MRNYERFLKCHGPVRDSRFEKFFNIKAHVSDLAVLLALSLEPNPNPNPNPKSPTNPNPRSPNSTLTLIS